MNQHPGVIGRKLGMTQIFTADGTVVPCTVVEAGSFVVGKRTQAKDGYDALILGFGDKREKRTTKALLGQFEESQSYTQTLTERVSLRRGFRRAI